MGSERDTDPEITSAAGTGGGEPAPDVRDVPAIRPPTPSITVTAEPPAEGRPDGSTAIASPGKQADVIASPQPTVMVQLRGAGTTAARQVRAWSARPVGRVVLPGLLLAALLGVAGVSGRYIAPDAAVAHAKQTAPPAGTQPPVASAGPSASEEPMPGDSVEFSPPASSGTGGTIGRPSDVLATWAGQMAAKTGIPEVAMQAYGYAELAARTTQPACNLSWTTLAGIGKVESDHGRADGAQLGSDGKALPSIVGPPLDGQGGRKAIPDTDGGTLDTDRSWDRAVGPMQFIPSTWKQYAIDADNDGVTDINDIDDASLAAADYLCASNHDLATPDGWKAAISSYNAVNVYLNDVFNASDLYGRESRS